MALLGFFHHSSLFILSRNKSPYKTLELVSGLVNETEVGPPLEKSKTGSLEMIPENCPLDPNGRLSISLDDQVRFGVHIAASLSLCYLSLKGA